MSRRCHLRISRAHAEQLKRHLFPGDVDEHGAVLLAGVSSRNGQLALHVREVHTALDGVDYQEGRIGYRAMQPPIIHRLITRARDERLAYLAVHNHEADRTIGFSQIDLESHERGYPALLQIAKGMPVGGIVCGHASMQADVWLPDGNRLELDEAVVVGTTVERLTAQPRYEDERSAPEMFDRQIRMFGCAGQRELSRCHAAIIGLGGIGSLVSEYLTRLGVGKFTLVDDDVVEESNLSRILGASIEDVTNHTTKVALAGRMIRTANPTAHVREVVDDVSKESVALKLIDCDYLFLAADSMRARLVFNALVHQFLIPGVQLGSKIRHDSSGAIIDILSVNRPVRPDGGCLWCNELIDPVALATEAKTDQERRDQAYGVEESNPSVIALNAISAAHAVNDFMLDYLGLRAEVEGVRYEQFNCLKRTRTLVEPRRDADCTECSKSGTRYGRASAVSLPCLEG